MSKNNRVKDLFQSAVDDGDLTQDAMNALTVVDIGAQIQAGLGVSVDDVEASDVVLLTIMPDDSGSIASAQNEQNVRDGHNLVLDALMASKQQDNVLAHTRYLNGEVLFPYVAISQAIRLDNLNYNPNKGTPLYDQAIVLLGTVLAKTKEFADNGVPARTITLIITDGDDVHSVRANPAMVKAVVDPMLRAENHIIAAMGIDDGNTDFREIFREMGIRDEWILTPANDQAEIRKAFQVFSQSAVRASQSAVNFSQMAMGGFGN